MSHYQNTRGSGRGRSTRGRGAGGRANSNYSQNTSNPPVCRFFLQNRCSFGDQCRFYHPKDIDAASIQAQVPPYGGALGYVAKKRQFDPNKSKAIDMAKRAQDSEPRPYADMVGPFYSLDIECVATGHGMSKKHRTPCRVALVRDDGDGEITTVLDECINLEGVEVVSYMTELTGTTKEQCLDPNAKTLEEVREMVKTELGNTGVLVGQSISHDVDWLGLEQGNDFRESFCTSIIFRQRIPKNLNSAGNEIKRLEEADADSKDPKEIIENSTHSNLDEADDSNLPIPTRYRIFSLRHCCIHLLGDDIQDGSHDPVKDAKYSLLLFNKYRKAPVAMLRAVRDSLHRAPQTPSFASMNPVLDGVVLNTFGYKMKASARFIWKWWTAHKNRR